MNDVPARPSPPDSDRSEAGDEATGPRPERATADQLTLRPTQRRYAEGLPSDGPNGQSSTPMHVARPSDPGAVAGEPTTSAPEGAEEVANLRRGAPDLGARAPDLGRDDG